MFSFFDKKKNKADWKTVYTTTDRWEAELVRSALVNQNIRAIIRTEKLAHNISGKSEQRNTVSVHESKLKEAELVIRRTSMVIAKKDEIIAEQAEIEAKEDFNESKEESDTFDVNDIIVRPIGEPILLAEKEGVGKIFFYEEKDTYELRLDMEFYKESHFMNGEEWDEFTNFSAQRQEFFILLKEKYPKLASLLKEKKMRPDFLKLIEYSYGKSQPPRKKEKI